MAYIEKQLKSLCGKACHGWSMLADGDSVGVGLSGGKDSMSLLWLLTERRRRIPIDYQLYAFHIDMGYGRVDQEALKAFCAQLEVELVVVPTDYGPRAHSEENRESPCFFCALNRRRELFQLAGRYGCGKLALAHHQDDIFETLLLNLFYAGSLSTMLPVQPFFGGELVVIRPLALANAGLTARFARHMGFAVQPPCCPSAGQTKRAEMGHILSGLIKGNRKVRANLWNAITAAGLDTLPTRPTTQRRPRSRAGS